MSNTSLREQLQAVASKLSNKINTEDKKPEKGTKAASTKRPAKPKPQWLEQAQYGVELLKAYFPACFKPASAVRPLKIGIKQDLVKYLSTLSDIVTEDKACMVRSLSYYVNTPTYLKSVQAGVERIDLNGKPAGIVSAEEASYSAERHQNKIKKQQTKTSSPETNQF